MAKRKNGLAVVFAVGVASSLVASLLVMLFVRRETQVLSEEIEALKKG